MFRCTPTSLYLCGAPKIGKSHLIIYICNKIIKKLKYNDLNSNTSVYARTVTTEHWDGYKQQPIIVFDDHYKANDNEHKIDATEIMNVISCTNYMPSFARLEFKGIPFNSKFLLITSNYGFPQTMFLPSALHRRHKFHVIVIKISNDYSRDFSHLVFYYTIELIDPWKGNYTSPFSQLHDVPYTQQEFNLLPFKEKYKKITLDNLINLVIQDHVNELEFFSATVFNKYQ